MSALEDLFAFQLRASKIKFEREVKLVPGRRFRWDFVIGDLAIEIQGSVWVKGAHSTGKGITRDADKLYLAVLNGFRPLVITGDLVKSGVGVQRVIQLIGEKK